MKKYILVILIFIISYQGYTQKDCNPPLNLTYSVSGSDVTLQWNSPQEKVFSDLQERKYVDKHQLVDSSPWYKKIDSQNSLRDFLDVQFSFPCHFADGEAGIESDGQYIYTAAWNGSRFACYNFDGSICNSFDIPGVENVRDMAFCEEDGFMYGTETESGISKIYKMDFTSKVLIETFYFDVELRSLAYDPDLDVFYSNNWNTAVSIIDRQTGVVLSSVPLNGVYGHYYGFAYDNWSANGPFVWGFSQDGSGNELVQLGLPAFNETGIVLDLSSIDTTGTGIAGGLFTQPGIVEGEVTLGGMIQNVVIFGLELSDLIPPPPNSVLAGYNVYRDGSMLNGDLINDSSYLDQTLNPGEYEYQVTAIYNDTLGSFICESPPAGPLTVTIEEPLALGGNVFAGTAKLDIGEANAFKIDSDNVQLAYTSGIDNFGYYFFHNCAVSDYYVLSKPGPASEFHHDYIPTYYGDVYHWENSNKIALQNNTFNADIHLIQLAETYNGSGRISGMVCTDDKDIQSSPATDILMLLLNQNNECVLFDYSDAQGYFDFTGLVNGTYKLLCEIAGKKMSPQQIVIDNTNPTADGINFIINEEEIVIGINEGLPPGISMLSNIYPNPARDHIRIEISVLNDEMASITVVSPYGQMLTAYQQKLFAGKNKIDISTINLSPGIYFLNLQLNNNYQISRRFIVVN